MRAMIAAVVSLAVLAAAPAGAQSEGETLYMLCQLDETTESMIKIAPGEFRMLDGDMWSENICEDDNTVCTVSTVGVFNASRVEDGVEERLSINLNGGDFSWSNGGDSQTGGCRQVAEPVARE